MSEDNFHFLRECLDEDTLNYAKLGLMPNLKLDTIVIQDDVIYKIGQILGVNSLEDAPYRSTIVTAFSPYIKLIKDNIQQDNKSLSARFIITCKKLINKLDSGKKINTNNPKIDTPNIDNLPTEEDLSIDSIFQLLYEWVIGKYFLPLDWDMIAKEWYPYFFLFLMYKGYPNWLTFKEKDFPIELFGLSSDDRKKYVNALPKLWPSKLKETFIDKDTREKFKQILFVLSFVEVLRRENSLLEEECFIPFPLQLPNNVSSKFMRIKYDLLSHKSIYETSAALILGVFKKSGLNSKEINSLMTQQITGEGSLMPIQPISLSVWQAKKIITHNSLDPFFAILSSLKYSEPSSWAQKYFDFQTYVEYDAQRLGNNYSGTLYINHFFPYHILKSCDVIKAEGLSTPEFTTDGKLTGNFIYQPIVREGICLDLIDRIYLRLSGNDDSMMKSINDSNTEIFSYIQIENIDDSVSRNYYKYLSNNGSWRIVKDKFEAELDKRVNEALADMRHNIKHYVDHLPRQIEKIEEFLITPDPDKTQRIIKYANDAHRNIKIALRELNSLSGLESEKLYDLRWNETILQLLDTMPNLNCRVSIQYKKGNVGDEIIFPFRGEKALYFAQMIQNILKNADDHGFKGYNIANPKIDILSQIDQDYLYLSFMNNGIPLSEGMTIDKYRTRGLSGRTGNSGLGGAQIDRIIRAHGGKIYELSSSEEWGFIIKIKFKL